MGEQLQQHKDEKKARAGGPGARLHEGGGRAHGGERDVALRRAERAGSAPHAACPGAGAACPSGGARAARR